MKKFSPIVITSRVAKDNFHDIKSQYTDVLNNLNAQSLKVQQFNMQKMQDEQMQQEKDYTMAKEQSEADNKRKEIEIKQAALLI